MAPSSGELWGYHLMPSSISVDCLLPTGVMIPLNCIRDSTLDKIKSNLFEEAKRLPLYGHLQKPSSYIFVSITQDAEKEEFYDESRRLCDLRLFLPMLKLVEPEGNKEEKMLNYEISLAIGVPVHEFDEMRDSEVIDFRRNFANVCKDAVTLRESRGEFGQMAYVYPPEVESNANIPHNIERKLEKGIVICVWVLSEEREEQKYTVKLSRDSFPSDVIGEAILKKVKSSSLTREEQHQRVLEHKRSYLLKVGGCEEYLTDEYPLIQYKYIRQCLTKGKLPQLMLFLRDDVKKTLPPGAVLNPSFLRRLPTITQPTSTMSLWNLTVMLKVKILSATYVNVKDVDKIYVKAGIYHGTELLCVSQSTEQVSYSNPKWNSWLQYDIYIRDTPCSARLCISICSVASKKRREEHCMLAWGNVSLFDYNHRLLSDKVSLHLWPTPKGYDELLNPLGTTGSNPNKDSPCLEIEFERFASPVEFPTSENIAKLASIASQTSSKKDVRQRNSVEQNDALNADKIHEDILQLTMRDPLAEIFEDEKELFWKERRMCMTIPDSLPKLLDSVKWYKRDEVAQMYMLLDEWPQVSPETALELLDCKYADMRVRKKAVGWLDKSLLDDKLAHYLLQLVQVLKYEPYLDNDLTRFLLKRALLNRKIGHFFFWHLKSELHNPMTTLRFGLLLEAFCRGLGSQLKHLNRQVEALEKLTKLTDELKERKDETQKDRLKFLYEKVRQSDYLEALRNFHSPLNHSHILGDLLVEECRILDSAKRPLWLVWQNPDAMAHLLFKTNSIIFKNGDDLRQDMLTLQVIRIMDNIWQNEGLDLRLLPYGCLATGKQVGMIDVVRNARTVMNIQRKGGKMAALQVDSTQLHKWIKDKNPDDKYELAIETFSRSCAGYCVATFILGIGDRNPDNIMVNEEGQIFHIDFGHFLGHFKKKFGINRERVPFVLTDDFLRVIAKGQDNPKRSVEFQEFQELCGKAYLSLRKHANLLITLFTMMLSTGIPELQSIDDIGYLRKTLAVEMNSDRDALQYFQNQFFEAYGGAWTTKLDWFFHSVKHM